nr:MAG: FKBP-type peptidyl-prolyl cis-trans isomerase [Hyphomicrobiales bacterium]
MRSKFFAAAAVFIGVVALSACEAQQEQVEVEQEPAEGPTALYDLSPESNAQFLAENAEKEGVIVRPSGLQYRVINAGNGDPLSSPEDMATVSYSGSLIDGTVFDETDPGETVKFPADGLIAGWVEALSLMKEGDRWELVVPSELGYGAFGIGGFIPPNQTLVFEMELVEVGPPEPANRR